MHFFENALWAGVRGRYALFAAVNESIEADALLAAGLVEEQVGGDAVQPSAEGSGLISVERAEHPEERFLGEVLGVLTVAR